MRQRPASRILLVDAAGRVLLFRFGFPEDGPLKGLAFWATPGGERDAHETFEACAIRELAEETGLAIDDPGPQVERREFPLKLHDGENVMADERYFRVHIDGADVSYDSWTELERQVMHEHRWWSVAELRATGDTVYPEGLADLLDRTAPRS